jgi:hypothetical protein
MAALRGSGLCFNHSPTTAKSRSIARYKGGRQTRVPNAPTVISPATTAIVMLELTQALADAKRHPNTLQRGMLTARLGLALVKVIEVSQIEDRLDAIERRLEATERERRG